MRNVGIENILINLENNKTIIANNKLFSNLYISNINEDGDEIPYNEEYDSYISNFFMIKLKNKTIEYNLTNKYLDENAFKLIKENKSIESIIINFKNGTSIPFILNSNKNFLTFKDKNDLCIVQSEYNIKYYENLFI